MDILYFQFFTGNIIVLQRSTIIAIVWQETLYSQVPYDWPSYMLHKYHKSYYIKQITKMSHCFERFMNHNFYTLISILIWKLYNNSDTIKKKQYFTIKLRLNREFVEILL